MSASDPNLPKDPAAYRRRGGLGLGFWVWMAFGVLCVLAGVGVAYLGPRLLPPKPTGAPVQRALAPAPPRATAPPATPTLATAPSDVVELRARIAALESQGARSNEAAAAALAAAAVIDASRSSRPFPAQVAALRQAAPDLPELQTLVRLAETGAPSRTSLYASYPEFAARAAVRARKPAEDAGMGERFAYAVSKVVQVRRVDDVTGKGPDALLARAELALEVGDVIAALRFLDGLPAPAKRAMAPWRADAERRAEIDRHAAALRQRATADLDPAGPAA